MDYAQSIYRLWLTLLVVPAAISYSWLAKTLLSSIRVPVENSFPPLSIQPPRFDISESRLSLRTLTRESLAGFIRLSINFIGLIWSAYAVLFIQCPLDSTFWSNLWWASTLSCTALAVIKGLHLWAPPSLLEAVWCLMVGCRWRAIELLEIEHKRENPASHSQAEVNAQPSWSTSSLDVATRSVRSSIVALSVLPVAQFVFIGLSCGIKERTTSCVVNGVDLTSVRDRQLTVLLVTSVYDASATILYIGYVLIASRNSSVVPRFWGHFATPASPISE